MINISFAKESLNQDAEIILNSHRNGKNYDSNDTVFNPPYLHIKNQKPVIKMPSCSSDKKSKENYTPSLSFFRKGPITCPSSPSCNFKNDFVNQKDIIEKSLNGINNVEVKNNYTFNNGDTFSGQFLDNMPHGNGIYKSTELNTLYKGKFHMGKRQGTGEMTYISLNYRIDSGNWIDD